LRWKAKDWFKKLQPTLANWIEMKTRMQQKFGDVNLDEIRMKMDTIKQEPQQHVQLYFDRLDKLYMKGKIKDVQQKCNLLAHLCLEIRKQCMVKNYANIQEMLPTTKGVEMVLGELGETPFEPFKEK